MWRVSAINGYHDLKSHKVHMKAEGGSAWTGMLWLINRLHGLDLSDTGSESTTQLSISLMKTCKNCSHCLRNS